MATKEQRPLTKKQRAFCEAYVGPAEYSARKAYLMAFDATEATAATQGPTLTHESKSPRIYTWITERRHKSRRLKCRESIKEISRYGF